MTLKVGLVGARGHTGRELLRLIAARDDLDLAFASSREFEGRSIANMAPETGLPGHFVAYGPEAAAQAVIYLLHSRCILGLYILQQSAVAAQAAV